MSQTDKPANEPRTERQPPAGLGLEQFAMSSVRSMETQDASEVSTRLWKSLSWVLLVAIVVGGVLWWLREGRNVLWRPTKEDEQFILSLKQSEPARQGMITSFEFGGRITLNFEVNRQFSLTNARAKRQLREAVRELVKAFGVHRPNEEVRVKGYQFEEMVADGRLRVSGKQAGEDASIWVHIEGEEEEMVPPSLGHID